MPAESRQNETLGDRLRQARELAGFSSTRQVAEALSVLLPISHATIANYEKGKTSPDLDMLHRLAQLYKLDVSFFMEEGTRLVGVRFRKTVSRVKAVEERQFLASAQRWLDAYRRLENRLGKPLTSRQEKLSPGNGESGREFAARVRRELKLGDAPVPSVVKLLEDEFGVRVLELPTAARIDGFAAEFGDGHAVILNPKVSNDRGRLNASHELGHVLFDDCSSDVETKEAETRGFEFGFCLLLPPSVLTEAFAGRSMVKLVRFKELYGISLSAMVYRAKEEKIITEAQATNLWIEFAKRGWRQNEPGTVRADRAVRFERLYEECVLSGQMSEYEALRVMGIREEEMRERLQAATSGWLTVSDHDSTKEVDASGERDVIPFPQ